MKNWTKHEELNKHKVSKRRTKHNALNTAWTTKHYQYTKSKTLEVDEEQNTISTWGTKRYALKNKHEELNTISTVKQLIRKTALMLSSSFSVVTWAMFF